MRTVSLIIRFSRQTHAVPRSFPFLEGSPKNSVFLVFLGADGFRASLEG